MIPSKNDYNISKKRALYKVRVFFVEGSGGGGGKCMKDGGMVLPTPHHLEKG